MTFFSKIASHKIEKHSKFSQSIWYFDKVKSLKVYDLVLLLLQKKLFLVLGATHGDPIFAQVGPKNGYF